MKNCDFRIFHVRKYKLNTLMIEMQVELVLHIFFILIVDQIKCILFYWNLSKLMKFSHLSVSSLPFHFYSPNKIYSNSKKEREIENIWLLYDYYVQKYFVTNIKKKFLYLFRVCIFSHIHPSFSQRKQKKKYQKFIQIYFIVQVKWILNCNRFLYDGRKTGVSFVFVVKGNKLSA